MDKLSNNNRVTEESVSGNSDTIKTVLGFSFIRIKYDYTLVKGFFL